MIKPGQAWGEPAMLPDDAVIARSDREISRALGDARRRGDAFATFGLLGGDLCRTLGGRGDAVRLREGATVFPVDVGEVLVDGRHHFFAAHVAAHDRMWRRLAVAMNAQWIGEWNFGPKAHPNDGLIDAYEGGLGVFEWRKVRRRLPSGTHLPHPRIHQTRAKAVTIDLPRALAVFVDGEPVGRARHLAVRVIPDALRVFA